MLARLYALCLTKAPICLLLAVQVFIFLFGLVALFMTVYGMSVPNKTLVSSFWNVFDGVQAKANSIDASVQDVLNKADSVKTAVNNTVTYIESQGATAPSVSRPQRPAAVPWCAAEEAF